MQNPQTIRERRLGANNCNLVHTEMPTPARNKRESQSGLQDNIYMFIHGGWFQKVRNRIEGWTKGGVQ